MIQLPLLTSEQVDNHLAWELHEANQQARPDIHPHNHTEYNNEKAFALKNDAREEDKSKVTNNT